MSSRPDPFDPQRYKRRRGGVPPDAVVKVRTEFDKLRDTHFFPRLPEKMFLRLTALNPSSHFLYLALWRIYLTHEKKNPFSVSTSILTRWGISRKTKYSGLNALEAAGIIAVKRLLRRNPLVTLLGEKLRP
jgi:hypothetical protein